VEQGLSTSEMVMAAEADKQTGDQTGKQVLLEVETVSQIFNDADVDPFSAPEGAVLGEAALERLLTRLQVHPLRDWKDVQLVISLPADQITPEVESGMTAAIRRYCEARIEDNDQQVRLGRKQHLFGMIVVTTLVLGLMLIAYLLFTTVLAGTSMTIQTLVVASISVFAWVILWDPLEALLFDWAPPARENRALGHVLDMQVIVRSQS
jgi:hypothetical protein